MRDARTSCPAVVLLLLLSVSFAEGAWPSPPRQPLVGPGGVDYLHAEVSVSGPFYTANRTDKEARRYFLYEPAGPTPETAPVVLFIHGYQAGTPDAYTRWIEHIVRKGYTVVWVQYQTFLTLPGAFAKNALGSWRDALGRLETGLHVRPEKGPLGEAKTAFVGHSAGGYLSAILAARAANPVNGVPRPYAIVAVEPGGINAIPAEDLQPIPGETKLLVVVGDEDNVVCKVTGVGIWEGTPQIPAENRDFLIFRSDRHGVPRQISNHFFPNTDGFNDSAAVDARDFFITFKLSVAMLNCVFEGTDCDVALGHGSRAQVRMGRWSDGVAVRPMERIEDPGALQTTCQDP